VLSAGSSVVNQQLIHRRAPSTDKSSHPVPPSPSDNNLSESVDPSPVASSSGGTDFTDVEETFEEDDKETVTAAAVSQLKSPIAADLKVSPLAVDHGLCKVVVLSHRRIDRDQ
jgi:hypothetical protein